MSHSGFWCIFSGCYTFEGNQQLAMVGDNMYVFSGLAAIFKF